MVIILFAVLACRVSLALLLVQEIKQRNRHVQVMAGVMQEAIRVDDSAAVSKEQRFRQLRGEIDAMRELLEVSVKADAIDTEVSVCWVSLSYNLITFWQGVSIDFSHPAHVHASAGSVYRGKRRAKTLTRGLKPAAAFAIFAGIRQAYWVPRFGSRKLKLAMPLQWNVCAGGRSCSVIPA